MPESGMSGSVGAAGEQSPVATRRLDSDYWYLSLANCHSSHYGELIKPTAVSLQIKIIKHKWELRSTTSNFSWCVTIKRVVGAMLVVIDLKI